MNLWVRFRYQGELIIRRFEETVVRRRIGERVTLDDL